MYTVSFTHTQKKSNTRKQIKKPSEQEQVCRFYDGKTTEHTKIPRIDTE
jgi:hypothetical protein